MHRSFVLFSSLLLINQLVPFASAEGVDKCVYIPVGKTIRVEPPAAAGTYSWNFTTCYYNCKISLTCERYGDSCFDFVIKVIYDTGNKTLPCRLSNRTSQTIINGHKASLKITNQKNLVSSSCNISAIEPFVPKVIYVPVKETIIVKPPAKKGLFSWTFMTCNKCKMVFMCERFLDECDEYEMKIIDKENKPKFPCKLNARTNKILIEGSQANLMIENLKNIVSASCNISAAYPYQQFKIRPTDLQEFGSDSLIPPTCPCGWTNRVAQQGGRIVGGKETVPHEYPFIVLFGEADDYYCGGSIISPYHVLTAGHCINDEAAKYEVAVGAYYTDNKLDSKNRKIINVKKIYLHPKFIMEKYNYDIAVAHLHDKIEYSQVIGPICMPKRPINMEGMQIKLIGWGKVSWRGKRSTILKKTYTQGIDLQNCRLIFPETIVGNTQFCAYNTNTDACQGDSGGPAVVLDENTNMYTLRGIVSMGYRCNTSNPGVYTDVAAFMPWIMEKIAETQPTELCF